MNPLRETEEVPDILYHGTSHALIKGILREGLKPMKRGYVHLTSTINEAVSNARRKKGNPKIIVVDVKKAIIDGVLFWKAAENIYFVKTCLQSMLEE